MWTTTRLLAPFILFSLLSYKQALREFRDMKWKENPAKAWPPFDIYDRLVSRIVILILNEPNFLNNTKEKTIISTGILLDNSRILTAYNPFRNLSTSFPSNITDKIVAVLHTGRRHNLPTLGIANIVCGRQITYVPGNANPIWYDIWYSPLHDLMVIGMEEEIGIARSSPRFNGPLEVDYEHFYWLGQLEGYNNALISYLAAPNEDIRPEVQIYSLGFRNKKEMKDYYIIHNIYYEDDAVLVDCEEWLPREWGFFICIRNINNLPSLGSGAVLFSNNKVFGIGSFAMFTNHTGILVFTDVRHYNDLIMRTCGDEEFT